MEKAFALEDHFHINEGKTVGLRIFRAQDFLDRPAYVEWTKAALAKLKRR